MALTYVTGFPRIGEQRELKKVLERYWSGACDFTEVEKTARELKRRHWEYQRQAGVTYIACNDFSYYDAMLDTAVMLGAVPERFRHLEGEARYFAMARGDENAVAMEMTKWFNTNYHYIVPELSLETPFKLDASSVVEAYEEAKEAGVTPKINLIGPLTFLGLSKRIDRGDTFELFGKILPLYVELLQTLSKLDARITVQIDEPILVTTGEAKLLSLIKPCYDALGNAATNVDIIVATYFEHAREATKVLLHTPVYGIALDFIYGKENFDILEEFGKSDKTLIAGVIDGRNIWKCDIDATVTLLERISDTVACDRIIPSTSCSLLHVPYTLRYETKMDAKLKNWLSFALEKLDELRVVSKIFNGENLELDDKVLLEANITANATRKKSSLTHDVRVRRRMENISVWQRETPFEKRIGIQHETLGYKPLATTTIGSFPQTPEIRRARRDFKQGLIDEAAYKRAMRDYIDACVAFQEDCGLEVLVHGEPERNDMVEYFGEQLQGFGFTQNGWVQSYGSRCVKPPFIYGDVSRPEPMTVEWITYAQSLTKKPMKGMLTGPVTILNWSFVRDDLPRSEVSKQIALAIYDEICDLQEAGIGIVQVDEAAFKEGYPLRKEKIAEYEAWAVRDFKLAVSGAWDKTQIHTHMCYSEFDDIIRTIEAMDADVISIETARSGNTLLKIFAKTGYKQEVGPGVYDIHSPRIPTVEEIVAQIHALLEVLPARQLWINPDCGLKTRKWEEVDPALRNMVKAVHIVRKELGIEA
jgi:5-methyltetrahydropteroyltriglutamate--homocysteine methyltransferase